MHFHYSNPVPSSDSLHFLTLPWQITLGNKRIDVTINSPASNRSAAGRFVCGKRDHRLSRRRRLWITKEKNSIPPQLHRALALYTLQPHRTASQTPAEITNLVQLHSRCFVDVDQSERHESTTTTMRFVDHRNERLAKRTKERTICFLANPRLVESHCCTGQIEFSMEIYVFGFTLTQTKAKASNLLNYVHDPLFIALGSTPPPLLPPQFNRTWRQRLAELC